MELWRRAVGGATGRYGAMKLLRFDVGVATWRHADGEAWSCEGLEVLKVRCRRSSVEVWRARGRKSGRYGALEVCRCRSMETEGSGSLEAGYRRCEAEV